MKLDVNMEFKRSMLAVVIVIAATVVACFKIISGEVWLGIVSTIYTTYFATRTVEEAKKLKNGNGGITNVVNGADAPVSYDEKIRADNAPK